MLQQLFPGQCACTLIDSAFKHLSRNMSVISSNPTTISTDIVLCVYATNCSFFFCETYLQRKFDSKSELYYYLRYSHQNNTRSLKKRLLLKTSSRHHYIGQHHGQKYWSSEWPHRLLHQHQKTRDHGCTRYECRNIIKHCDYTLICSHSSLLLCFHREQPSADSHPEPTWIAARRSASVL